jgi:hypothetical protein
VFVALDDGRALSGDQVLKVEQRFDLTAVPSTLELTVAAGNALSGRVVEGATLLAGSGPDKYVVLKVKKAFTPNAQSAGSPREVVQVIATLDAFTGLARPLPRCVVKEGRSLGEVYRSCGARARIGADIPTVKFTCFAGDFPTLGIAQLLQEEGAAPVWRDGGLSFYRYIDLFSQKPKYSVSEDMTRVLQSAFLEGHEVPRAISTDTAGAVNVGPGNLQRPVMYLPRMPARVLANFSRYIAVRRELSMGFEGGIRAGDVINVGEKPFVVVTVAHLWETGSGGEASSQITRMWLGELQGIVL